MSRSSSQDRAPQVLALDIGTSSVRSALFNSHARLLPHSRAQQEYKLHHSLDHAAELDPAILLRATRACLRKTRECAKHDTPLIAASGFWHSLLGLNDQGRPLTPIYTWGDARSMPDAARLRAQLDEHAVQQRTGCMLRTSFWPAKLAWLRRTDAKLFRRVARWVSPAEWVLETLFGARACSHSMASGTGLYDFRSGDWDEELLKVSGVTRAQLNPLHDEVSLKNSRVFPAIGDGAAGNLGSGAMRPGVVAINVGTSAAVRTIAAARDPLPFGLFRLAVDQRRNLLGGAISNAGNLRAWCLRELALPDDGRQVEKLLRDHRRRVDQLQILPFWMPERAPTWPEEIPSAILGLEQASSAADLLAACVFASYQRLASILERLEEASGRAREIIVSGGIAQSRASLQMLADSLGRNLRVCADQEASLRGAAVYALQQAGFKPPPPKFGRNVRHEPAATRSARERRLRQEQLERSLAAL